MKILVVFNLGDKQCEHKYLYDKPEKINMTFPASCKGVRVCEKCGRMERFVADKLVVKDKNFNKVFNKFAKEK